MEPSESISTKADLRRTALARREAMSPEERIAASAAIAERGEPLLAGLAPRVVAGYIPIRSEADPGPLIAAARGAGAEIALPAVDGSTLVFRRWRSGEPLVPGRFGLSEPRADAPVRIPDLALVPLVGFDRTGHRLGYGLGYYDRALAELRAVGRLPVLVGIAFAAQEVAWLGPEDHDIALDWLITELDVIRFGS